ncbi:hypothetical protein J6590_100804 [Homalodisca vitripennis]|nr:hypothetical protein J6590_100804 [Homalodisca vitripennis]
MADNVNGMYSFEKYTDMILIYGKVNKNGLAAVQEYRDTFPHRRTPDRKTFEARIDTGRQRSARNYNNEQAIINAVELSPTTSTRRLSHVTSQRGSSLSLTSDAARIGEEMVDIALRNVFDVFRVSIWQPTWLPPKSQITVPVTFVPGLAPGLGEVFSKFNFTFEGKNVDNPSQVTTINHDSCISVLLELHNVREYNIHKSQITMPVKSVPGLAPGLVEVFSKFKFTFEGENVDNPSHQP